MGTLKFLLMTFWVAIVAVAGVAVIFLGYSLFTGLEAVMAGTPAPHWVIVSLLEVAAMVALVALAGYAVKYLLNWSADKYMLLRKLVEAQIAYDIENTEANGQAWREAKFNFDEHLGMVQVKVRPLGFDQSKSTTVLRPPHRLG